MTEKIIKHKIIGAIWAQSENHVIGLDNTLPWYLPEDLKHFKTITSNKTVIMGRKTWDSLPHQFKPLPKRKNVILSRTMEEQNGVTIARSIEEALNIDEEIWFIGGSEIYRQALPYLTDIQLTRVPVNIEGDAFAPNIPTNFILNTVTTGEELYDKKHVFFEHWVKP